jgi:CubicO group peptidase (beta-lactamase class C family)
MTGGAGAPGYVAAIVRAGVIADIEVSGIANADTEEPLRADSVFYVGSIAKQFVAACTRSLIDEGALGVDTSVGSVVGGLAPWSEQVRIRHLVHHTSGLADRDHSMFPGLPVTGVPARSNDDLMADLRRVDTLASPPGTAYRYTNRGYHLLGQAVAAASGRSVASLAAERLFAPLGMRDTFFRDSPTALPPSAARGHFIAVDGNAYVEPAAFHAVGAGGLWTTAGDLARWDGAFYDADSIAPRLAERGALDDGTPIHYGWGLSMRTHRGLAIQSHGGSFPGWLSKMVRFPAERTTVIVLANTEAVDASAMAFAIADRELAGALNLGAPHADDTFE